MVRNINESTAVELRTLIVTAIGSSIATWDIAFWLGVHGTIFYNKLFTLWISATAILLVALCVPKRDRFLTRWGMLALATPSIWFFTNSVTSNLTATWVDELTWLIALGIFVATIPYILYILFQLVESDALAMSPTYRNRLIGIVLAIALLGYYVGSNHQYFVPCEDFAIAGDTAPDNCERWEAEE